MKNCRQILAIALLCILGPSLTTANPLPVEAFATPPDISYVKLSPDGKHLAFRHKLTGDSGTAVRIYNTETGEVKDLAYAKADEFNVNWIRWANNELLLMSAIFAATRDRIPTTETRLVAIDINSGEHRGVLNSRYLRKQEYMPQFQDQIVDILKSDDDHILMRLRVKFENEYA